MEEENYNRVSSNYEFLEEEGNNNLTNKSETFEHQDIVEGTHSSTYIEVITERDSEGQPLSVLEVDLVISREKGKETRRLQINFTGIDMEKKEMVEKSVNIDRQSFERLKHFFCNLDWNS